MRTDIGSIKTDLKLSSNKEKGYFSYSGAVKTEEFELGNMLANDRLGNIQSQSRRQPLRKAISFHSNEGINRFHRL